MKLARLAVENFRGIVDLVIDLDEVTVLIGENNTGKTSVLESLNTCLSRGLTRRATPFSEYDFHLADDCSQPSDAPPIVLTMTFEESAEEEWPAEIDQVFDRAIQILEDNRKRLTFRVTSRFDPATRDFAVEWAFLDKAGSALPTARQPKLVSDLQALSPVFYLPSTRDASHHFHAKSPFWSPFTKNPGLDETRRQEIESQIEALNQSILDTHAPFKVVKASVSRTGSLVPLAPRDAVSIEAVPARIFDILAKTQVKLACRTGAKLPIGQHGAGTQSLSVLFLFEAFLQSQLAAAYDKYSEPILALEEPESHLHPSAIRAIWTTLDALAGQKIIATHSGDLLAAVPLKAIRRLARKSGQVSCYRVKETTLNDRELEQVRYHIREKRGALLFARCWLLVEGETDYTVLPELGLVLGYDFSLCGVCCVEVSQGGGPKPFVKVAEDLGIEWHLLADGDPAGDKYVKAARKLLAGTPESERVTQLTAPNIELTFWHSGYEAIYESAAGANQRRDMVKSPPGSPDYPKQVIGAAAATTSKPHMAYEAAKAAASKGPAGVPAELRAAIETAVHLAGRCA